MSTQTQDTTGPERKPILAHPQDIHCVVFHVVLTLGYVLAMILYLHPVGALAVIETSVLARLAYVAACALMLGWCSGINVGVNFHNHTHRKIFNSPALNTWFGRTWTVSGAWPSFFWQHAHVTVHHAHLLEDIDWTLPKQRPDGSFENIYTYSFFAWPFRYTPALWKDFTGGRWEARIGRKALIEFVIFLALWSIPFLIDPVMALGLWLLPAIVANAMVMAPGMYAQHAGCVRKTEARPYSHSTTFVSKLFNLTMFNIGYHIEHHDHPNVHWSQLPQLHEKLKPELVAAGAHIVPFGYYRAGQLLCRGMFFPSQLAKFREQHPDYRIVAAPAAAPVAAPVAGGVGS